MIRKLCFIFAVLSTALISLATAQQAEKVTSSGIGYLEYLPKGYHSNNSKYPIVISLHGIKEKGTSSTDPKRVRAELHKVDNVGLPKYVKNGKQYPFILISPQLKSNQGSWPGSYIMQVLKHVKKYLRIDDRRIYLTGLSLGGLGVWRTAGEYPEVFAAIVPVCAGGNAISKAKDIASENVAVWAFHGDRDNVVSYRVTTSMVDAINRAPKKPNPLAKTTLFRGMSHSIWDKAYNQTDALDWMLSIRNGSAPPRDDSDDDDDREAPEEEDDDDDDDNSSNKAPVVTVGADKRLVLPENSIEIRGAADDSDGRIASYKWTQLSGSKASLSGTTTSKLKAYNLQEGSYVFSLTVKDDDGASRSDKMLVRVERGSKSQDGDDRNDDDKEDDNSSSNSAPFAYSGPDRVLTLPANSITIQGQASDRDGRIVSYQWTKTYGDRASLSGDRTSKVRISNLRRGVYIFRLTVKDNKGAVKDDYFKITVKDKPNT